LQLSFKFFLSCSKVQNTLEEKRRLKRRRRIENFNPRLKKLVGENFSQFRLLASARVMIAIAVVTPNLDF
jgi:hypothetical protein